MFASHTQDLLVKLRTEDANTADRPDLSVAAVDLGTVSRSTYGDYLVEDAVFTATPPAKVVLNANTNYFLELSTTDPEGEGGWAEAICTSRTTPLSLAGWSVEDGSLERASSGSYDAEYRTKFRLRVGTEGKGLALSTARVTVEEGNEATFEVELSQEPTGNVTVAVTSGGESAVTVSPSSLTFTTGDWDDAQTVTVTGVEDDDPDDEEVTVTLAASGGGYAGVSVEAWSVIRSKYRLVR